MTPRLLPSLPILLILRRSPFKRRSALHPLLTSHLRKTGKRTRKRKPLLVTTENRRALQRLHRHTKVVH